MVIEAGSKLVMIGDSITDCGRARPVGEGLFDAYGNGYVNLVASAFGAMWPQRKVRAVNMGCSGNTVRDIKSRWQTDTVDLAPDWVSLMVGINDVWRHFDLPLQVGIHVGIEEYEETLDELVQTTLPSLKGMVLMTPYFVEPNRSDPMREMMDRFGAVVKLVAEKHGTVFVDTQAAFDSVLQHCHPMSLAWDRVHVNTTGHTVLARAFLEAIGFGE